jgi:hypothetical protein
MTFNSSTDAYQAASKIMSHEYANKYANYWSKKQKTIKSGKANFKDSGRQKTYNAEFKALREYKSLYPNDARFKFLNWKGSQKLFKKIAKSATYQKLCDNTVGSSSGRNNPTLEKAAFRGATAGQATWFGAMRLKENNCPYTIVHEFAHLCGNMHHDIGFRRDVIKLSSMFLGKEFGNILKKCFKEAKLKITTGSHIMSPEQWIASVMRMEKIREGNS